MIFLNRYRAYFMNNLQRGLYIMVILAFIGIAAACTKASEIDYSKKICLAYVVDKRDSIPDPFLFSHLIYSFGEFNDDNDGFIIKHPDKLRKMAELKQINTELKVILGIGGLKREGFSEMAGDRNKRNRFVKQCRDVINEYNLDGIDLDWEFPGTEKGGHTASENDAENYGLLVADLRKKLGKKKWISFYSHNSGEFIDFNKMLPYVDFVNVSGYNLFIPTDDAPLFHQSALFPSRSLGKWCIEKSVGKHLEKGVPPQKILLGIPFYGRGKSPYPIYLDSNQFEQYSDSTVWRWDEEAGVPYGCNDKGEVILTFDNERSIEMKSRFIRENGLAGAFVWNYDSDYKDRRLSKALHYAMDLQPNCESNYVKEGKRE